MRRLFTGSADFSFSASAFDSESLQNPFFDSLDYWSCESIGNLPEPNQGPDIIFLSDLIKKSLHRGRRTFLQPETEALIFGDFSAEVAPTIETDRYGTLRVKVNEAFRKAYLNCSPLCAAQLLPDTGEGNPFDPDNPQNEFRLAKQLFEVFGPEVGSFLYPQCPLDQVLPSGAGADFRAQRLDFLLLFPNGKGLVLEPGDHDKEDALRDRQREHVVRKHLGIETIRIPNDRIGSSDLGETLEKAVAKNDGYRFLGNNSPLNWHLTRPFAIHRIEHCLNELLLGLGMFHEPTLTVAIVEQDVAVAEIALLSFLTRVDRFSELYDLNLAIPPVQLSVISVRNSEANNRSERPSSAQEAASQLEGKGHSLHFSDIDSLAPNFRPNLFIDVSTSSGYLQRPTKLPNDPPGYVVRNSFPHSRRTSLRSKSSNRGISFETMNPAIFDPFVQEFFRKEKLRPEQVGILKSILLRQDTIGLLPTGAGKSLCYQLASLLTVGTTIIVDPLVALMDDQAAALRRRYHIDRVFALHAASNPPRDLGVLFEENLFVFLSPERFLRFKFREAIRIACQAGFPVNFAVVDEAHCVSMWGHDFRPAYIKLADNIRRHIITATGPPPILALTGTASQLVLIDLTRQLGITEPSSIIRPQTFNREELNFRVIPAPSAAKAPVLDLCLNELADLLRVNDPLRDTYGIIFTHFPKDVLKVFSYLFGKDATDQLLNFDPERGFASEVQFGLYCGGFPSGQSNKPSSLNKNWDSYKKTIFDRFTRGEIRCMVATSALSVGIDHEKIRYVVNLGMPASLESYYQQAGRAGRDGRSSYCFLFYTDERLDVVERWIHNPDLPARLPGDLGAIQWFQKNNFPGKSVDSGVLTSLIRKILRLLKDERDPVIRLDNGLVEDIFDRKPFRPPAIEHLERFVGYLEVLGIISEYTVEGMRKGMTFQLELEETFYQAVDPRNLDPNLGGNHILKSLVDYLSRYEPTQMETVRRKIEKEFSPNQGGSILLGAAVFLVDFLYERICYQRLQAVVTMLRFCKDSSRDPRKARQAIINYFDRSEFTEALEELRSKNDDPYNALELIEKVDDYSKAEQLFWECRRLLDETPRDDWRLISISCDLYINRSTVDELVHFILGNSDSRNLEAKVMASSKIVVFIADKTDHVDWSRFFFQLIDGLYSKDESRSIALRMVGKNLLDNTALTSVRQHLVNLQIKRLIHVARKR